MAYLEPDILLCQRSRWVVNDVFEALSHQVRYLLWELMRGDTNLQALSELLLLLVDYAEAKVYLVCLLKVWLHAHDLGEGFLRVFQGTIAVVQNPNSVPQFGFLNETCKHRALHEREEVAPWDLSDGKGLADKQCRLAVDLPSSRSSDLLLFSVVRDRLLHSIHVPKLPHTSPLLESSLRIAWRYSTAFGKFSLVRYMADM